MPQAGDITLGCWSATGCSRTGGAVEQLALSGLLTMPRLQQVVAALLPPGTQPCQLRSLALTHSRLQVSAMQNCSFLTHITDLTLSVGAYLHSSTVAVVEALLQQATSLRGLALPRCFRGEPLPPAVANRTGLLHLSLEDNELSDLPPGPYLTGELKRGEACLGS